MLAMDAASMNLVMCQEIEADTFALDQLGVVEPTERADRVRTYLIGAVGAIMPYVDENGKRAIDRDINTRSDAQLSHKGA